jgi:predicted phage-related endonuclease
MPTQNYASHRHNPKMTGIAFMFFVIAAVSFGLRWFYIGGRYTMAIGLAGILGAIFMLLSISRVYTTKLQDRIIKLEMRLRAATLLGPAQQAALGRLSKQQLVALRFASDEELASLIERAEREQMTADQIKRAIVNWVPDWDRT